MCRSYCRNRDDREDLVQEIVVCFWQSSRGFDERVRFSTWMYRVALNVACSFWRREQTRTRRLIHGDERLMDVAEERESEPDEIRLLYQFIMLDHLLTHAREQYAPPYRIAIAYNALDQVDEALSWLEHAF